MAKKKIEITEQQWENLVDQFNETHRYPSFTQAIAAVSKHMSQYKIKKKAK